MKRSGWTLLELLIVLILSSILLSISLFGVPAVIDHLRKQQARAEISTLGLALEKFHQDHSFYPPSSAITKNGEDYSENVTQYRQAGAVLFLALMGRQVWNAPPQLVTGKAYFDPLASQIFPGTNPLDPASDARQLATYTNDVTIFHAEHAAFRDPWGRPYGYACGEQACNPASYDLWSTAGGKSPEEWIKNW